MILEKINYVILEKIVENNRFLILNSLLDKIIWWKNLGYGLIFKILWFFLLYNTLLTYFLYLDAEQKCERQ
jgi:hypothetical protein